MKLTIHEVLGDIKYMVCIVAVAITEDQADSTFIKNESVCDQ